MARRAKKLRKDSSDANALLDTGRISAGMTNAIYVSLATEVADFQGKRDTFTAIQAIAKRGTSEDKAASKIAKRALILSANALSDRLNSFAKGDILLLLPSGFEITPASYPRVDLEAAKKFTVENTEVPRRVTFTAIKGNGCLTLEFQWGQGATFEAVTVWTKCAQSQNECVVSDLTSGERVWGVVTSIGRRGQQLMSAPVSTIVL